jgi:ribonuclease HII
LGTKDWQRLSDLWQLPADLAWSFINAKPTHIIGADEAGTGALAGPVMVCAAVVPVDWKMMEKLNDSKQLSRRLRVKLYTRLHEELEYTTSLIPSGTLDEIGLTAVLERGYTDTIGALLQDYPQAFVIIDGNRPYFKKANTLIKGDGKVPAIMAASVLGKALRDFHMVEMSMKYPGYDFSSCVGYKSKKHWSGILRQGLTPLHRRSYGPIRKYLEQQSASSVPTQG